MSGWYGDGGDGSGGLGVRRERAGDTEDEGEDGLWAHAQALPTSLLRYVSPQQLEFLAYGEDVDVQVVRADARARVLAVLGAARAAPVDRTVLRMRLHTFMALRAQYGAELRLRLPEYVSNARLDALLAAERAAADGAGVLTALPTPRFYGVCYVLVHYALAPAAAVAAGLDTARLLLQLNELFNVRMAKLEAALRSARAQRAAVIQCRNIADMELFAVRRRFTLFAETCAGLDRAHALAAAALSASGSAPSSQSSYSSSSYSSAPSAFRPKSVF